MRFALTRFNDPDEFYARVASFLAAREAENNLVLGVLYDVRAGRYSDYPPYLATVERDGDIALVALRTPPFGVLLSSSDAPDALKPLADDLKSIYDTLPTVGGPKALSAQFAELWKTVSGQSYRLKMAQRIYQLERVTPPRAVPGELRPVAESDREMLRRWFVEFDRGTFGQSDEKQVAQTVNRFLESPPEERELSVWEVDTEPVSMAGYSGPTPNGYRVLAVYTPPKYRRRGYASAATAAVSQRILDMGFKYCFLFTDLGNPTSNHIYREIGYEPVCDVDMYQFD